MSRQVQPSQCRAEPAMPEIQAGPSRRRGAAVVVHEAVKKFGAGAEIVATINERLHDQLRTPVRRIGAKFAPVSFSNVLETASLPALADVEEVIRALAKIPA